MAGVAGAGALAGCANSGSPDPRLSDTGGQPGSLIPLDQVPVGRTVDVIIDRRPAFVARPTSDTVRAFSAICPHQRCTVTVAGDILLCPCHRSQFELLTGKVLRGPAEEDLAPIPVHIDEGTVIYGDA